MAASAKFWDRMAKRYARQPVADEASYQTKLKVTQDYLRPEWEVLELGCGTGSTAMVHAPFVKHILATDISSGMLDIARDKIDKAGIPNITLKQGSVEGLELPDRSVDAVLALSLLHLLENWNAVIGRIFRVLRPGGIFVSSTVCLKDAMPLLRPVVPLMRLVGLAPMVKFISVRELTDCIKQAGFEIEHEWQPGKKKATFLIARKPE